MDAKGQADVAGEGDADLDVREVVIVLRRGWWLVLGLPLAVLVLTLATWRAPAVTYEARLRVAVDVPRSALVAGSDEGTAAKIGAALIDDIARVIPSQAFAEAVARRLPPGAAVDPGQIASDLSATDRHRIADVWVRRTVAADAPAEQVQRIEDDLLAIARGAVAELEENGGAWFARLGEEHIALSVIDRPTVAALPPDLRTRLEIPMRLALALFAGVILAFLRHALDGALHTAGEAAVLAGAPVVGRIPRRRRFGRGEG
jgi:uncharacterized protein involved in exopolysaccharide biosynthesis